MVRIIVSERVNGICYSFAISENIYSLSSLNKCVKASLLAKEKEIKKVWNAGTKLTANIYLDQNFACSIGFEL
jgi:ERCC4-type nuclease